MTDAELHSTVLELKSGLNTLTEEWGEFLAMEARRVDENALQKRRREESDSQLAAQAADNWEKQQTFFKKHGVKLLGILFTVVTSALAWYGARIRSEIEAQQRERAVDEKIQTNTANLADFKETTETNIRVLQNESVNQTLMIDEGFKRVDKIMLKATRLKEEDLPGVSPGFEEVVKEARKRSIHADKFDKDEKE